jgi:hypothetical protein
MGRKPVKASGRQANGGRSMRKFFGRLIVMTLALCAIGFVAFAYVGDLSPKRVDMNLPVTLTLK